MRRKVVVGVLLGAGVLLALGLLLGVSLPNEVHGVFWTLCAWAFMLLTFILALGGFVLVISFKLVLLAIAVHIALTCCALAFVMYVRYCHRR